MNFLVTLLLLPLVVNIVCLVLRLDDTEKAIDNVETD
jgi:hypothetical protein